MASFKTAEEDSNINAPDEKGGGVKVVACAVCSKAASFTCSRCLQIPYCTQGCQKSHWKAHKVVCTPPATQNFGCCYRCEKELGSDKGRCRVPHPASALQSLETSYFGSVTANYLCTACNQKITTVKAEGATEFQHTAGPVYCFDGRHSAEPLAAEDRRVLRAGEVVVNGTIAEMTAHLQGLKASGKMESITTLIVGDTNNYTGSGLEYRLCFEDFVLPAMRCLKMYGTACSVLQLTPETTPLLEELYLENLGDLSDNQTKFNVITPYLKKLTVHYLTALDSRTCKEFNAMLRSATKLVSISAYKARVTRMTLASNQLVSVILHRGECMVRLDLWAPRLKDLRLQACWDVEEVTVRSAHALRSRLPADFEPSRFAVDVTNSMAGLAGMFQSVPRCRSIIGAEDD